MLFPDTVLDYSAINKAHPNTSNPKRNIPNRQLLQLLDGKAEVATVSWYFDDEFLKVLNIEVKTTYRRQGVAKAIYEVLRKVTGKKLEWVRSCIASKEMKLFIEHYIQQHDDIESDDGNTIILKQL
jgi:predicted GNAT family acetyltransferase